MMRPIHHQYMGDDQLVIINTSASSFTQGLEPPIHANNFEHRYATIYRDYNIGQAVFKSASGNSSAQQDSRMGFQLTTQPQCNNFEMILVSKYYIYFEELLFSALYYF